MKTPIESEIPNIHYAETGHSEVTAALLVVAVMSMTIGIVMGWLTLPLVLSLFG